MVTWRCYCVLCCVRLSHFYSHESCGQCTPCREGTGWMEKILQKLEKGDGDKREIPMLEEISRWTPRFPLHYLMNTVVQYIIVYSGG